jgi:transcriptional regulator with XRE-family HTH domain
MRLFDELAQEWRTSSEDYARARALEQPKGFLGVNVFRLRKAAGLTQEQLAKRAGLRQPRIAEIERGDANPRLETIAKVAYALNAEVAELLRNPDNADVAQGSRAGQRVRARAHYGRRRGGI